MRRAHLCTLTNPDLGKGVDYWRWWWICSASGLGFKQQMNQVCNRIMDWDCRSTRQCKYGICCCNRIFIGTAMQPHVVPTPAPALPMWSRLCLGYTWKLCWLSSALCLIKIKSLLQRLQSAKTSKERLVKQHDYLQTQRNEIFFYCHNWKSTTVYGCVSWQEAVQRDPLPLHEARHWRLIPPALAVLSHSCYVNKALLQPRGSASPLQSLYS